MGMHLQESALERNEELTQGALLIHLKHILLSDRSRSPKDHTLSDSAHTKYPTGKSTQTE